MNKNLKQIILLCSVLLGMMLTTPVTQDVAAKPATELASPQTYLNTDGSLNPTKLRGSASLNLDGWDVQMDSQKGPILKQHSNTSAMSLPSIGTWGSVGNSASINNQVNAILVSGTDVYVGGYFTDAAGIPEADYIAKWDGANWSALGSNGAGNGVFNDGIFALALDTSGNLYAGGFFTDVNNNGISIPEADYLAKWDGSNWSALGGNSAGNGALDGEIYALAVDGSNIYAGGWFYNAAGIPEADSVAKWDGNNWSALGGSGNGMIAGFVDALAVSGTNVYVGGGFSDVAGIPEADYMAKWDGTNWSALGSNGAGDGALNLTVDVIVVSDTSVFVGGGFTNAAGIPEADNVAVWNGTDWSALGSDGSGNGAITNFVTGIVVSNTDVYIAGWFNDAAGIPEADHIAKWDGAGWSALGSNAAGDGALTNNVNVLAMSAADLYVGGTFMQAAGIPGADFIAKWQDTSDAGNPPFSWARNMGGVDEDDGYSIAVDMNGNVYTTGFFQGTADFDPGVGTANLTSTGVLDVFISKLDNNGNFLWARNMGSGTPPDETVGVGIAVDMNNNVYVTGYFQGMVDFDPGVAVSQLTAQSWDIFVVKLSGSGDFLWAKNMGGSGTDVAYGITTDSNNNFYLAGYFESTADFDPGAGTANLTSAGSFDVVISKLNSDGDFVWAKSMGGTGQDIGLAIALDSNNDILVTGSFMGTADFDPGAGIANLIIAAGNRSIFISKLDKDGNYVWAKHIGSANFNQAYGGIAVGSDNAVYVTGEFRGIADFDPGPATFTLDSGGSGNPGIFVTKLNYAGNFVWAKSMTGGPNVRTGASIALDANDNMYTTGYLQGTADFDPGPNTVNLTGAGQYDIFISILDNNGNYVWAQNIGGPEYDIGNDIALDGSGNVYLTGYFQGTADFNPGAGTTNLTTAGFDDIFILKLGNNPIQPDIVAPVVESVLRYDPSPTNANVISYTVTFSEAVTGVDSSDFTLTPVGVSSAAVSGVSGSGTTYTVSIETGTGNGTIRLDVLNDSSIADVAANPLGYAFSTGEVYTTAKTGTIFKSLAVNDGWVLESSATSSKGGTLIASGLTLFAGDAVSNRQYRSILHFDTKSIPDGAIVIKADLKLKYAGVAGTNPFKTHGNLLVDVRRPSFGTAPLTISDFQAGASMNSAGIFEPVRVMGWYIATLSNGLNFINKTGSTQFRLHFTQADNHDNAPDYLKLYSGNADAFSKPQLLIYYYVP